MDRSDPNSVSVFQGRKAPGLQTMICMASIRLPDGSRTICTTQQLLPGWNLYDAYHAQHITTWHIFSSRDLYYAYHANHLTMAEKGSRRSASSSVLRVNVEGGYRRPNTALVPRPSLGHRYTIPPTASPSIYTQTVRRAHYKLGTRQLCLTGVCCRVHMPRYTFKRCDASTTNLVQDCCISQVVCLPPSTFKRYGAFRLT